MARQFNGTSDFLASASALAALAGKTRIAVGFWFYGTFNPDDNMLLELSANSNSNLGTFAVLGDESGSSEFWAAVNSDAGKSAGATAAPTNSAWHHILINYAIGGTDEVESIWFDGVSQTLSHPIHNANTAGFTSQILYVMSRGGAALFSDGRLSDLCIWALTTTALGSTEATVLAGGARANTVRNSEIAYYWPLAGTASPEPASIGSVALTVTGTSTASDPPALGATPVLSVSAGADQAAITGDAVTLTATPSNATGSVTYVWSQTGGTTVTLSGSTSASASFTPPSAGTYTFQVVATDSASNTANDVVVITVSDPPPPLPTVGWMWGQRSDGSWEKLIPIADRYTHRFYVEDFGAVGDGATDDTAAIQACVTAAVAAAPDNNYAATVVFGPKTYLLATEPVATGFAWAQVRIPFIPFSSRKIYLTFEGVADIASAESFQDAPQQSGTVLKSTSVGHVPDTAWRGGVPAVLGGPADITGVVTEATPSFSNMCVIVDGISIQVPFDTNIGGFNFAYVAQAHIKSAGVFTDRSLQTDPAVSQPGTDNSYGVYMPITENNARNQIDTLAVEGLGRCLVTGEHTIATYLCFVLSYRGLCVGDDYSDAVDLPSWDDGRPRVDGHSITVLQMLCEGVLYWLTAPVLDRRYQVIIEAMDGENNGGFAEHVHDPDNVLVGHANLNDIWSETPVVNGGSHFRVVNDGMLPGAVTAPTVPGTATPMQNPFWRDASVYVHGGTVSAIKVAGATTGLTFGLIRVPTGQTIELDYSAAPAWTWVLD